ncbi:hypothetical protein [Pedobacter sp. GR22-6]|uniref:hypothetical protein n=1 Tax=Pedobacter sp. GR22-6 TaxID=3127957 RepID=UPI00307D278B
MKIILSILITSFLFTLQSEAQMTTVRKTTLLIKKFNGKHQVLPKDSAKSNITVLPNGVTKFTMGYAGDSYILLVLPYGKQDSFDALLSNLHMNYQPYLYNDIFITDIHPPGNNELKELKIDPVAFSELPKISFEELNRSNTAYIGFNRIKAACKAWLIDADWDMRVIDHKPKYLNGVSPEVLKFDRYFVHTLSKIHGISTLDQLEESAFSKVFKEGVLK